MPALRRYDMFAIWNFVTNLDKGMDEKHAKGEAIWLATWRASGGRGGRSGGGSSSGRSTTEPGEPQEWKCLSGKPQTDEVYDKNIIQRHGEEMYYQVLLPFVKKAKEEGKKYNDIRDCPCRLVSGGKWWCEDCKAKLMKEFGLGKTKKIKKSQAA